MADIRRGLIIVNTGPGKFVMRQMGRGFVKVGTEKPEMVHVILTGRNAHPTIVELADTVRALVLGSSVPSKIGP